MPKSSTPALLLTTMRSLVPLLRTAAIRFSGMPHSPKPPIKIVMPSRKLAMASSADAMRLSMNCSWRSVPQLAESRKVHRQLAGERIAQIAQDSTRGSRRWRTASRKGPPFRRDTRIEIGCTSSIGIPGGERYFVCPRRDTGRLVSLVHEWRKERRRNSDDKNIRDFEHRIGVVDPGKRASLSESCESRFRKPAGIYGRRAAEVACRLPR